MALMCEICDMVMLDSHDTTEFDGNEVHQACKDRVTED